VMTSLWRKFGMAAAVVLLAIGVPATAAVSVAVLDAGLAAHEAGDFRKARALLRPIADSGSAIAETLLGVMAARGEGAHVDAATAAAWWLRAANRGYGPAQLALAKALANGRGVKRDLGAAWVWARLAASAGNGSAAEAAALADRIGARFGADRLGALEAERAGWRPW
jgi:TPR repeat protein